MGRIVQEVEAVALHEVYVLLYAGVGAIVADLGAGVFHAGVGAALLATPFVAAVLAYLHRKVLS